MQCRPDADRHGRDMVTTVGFTKALLRACAVTAAALILMVACRTAPETSLEESGAITYQVQTSRSGSDYLIHRLVVYRDESDTVELGVVDPGDGSGNAYVLSVVFTGQEWRFMEGVVLIRMGSELLRLRDANPTHSGGFREPVTERVTVTLTRAQFRAITNGSRVAVEPHPGVLFYIERRGERAMRRFYEEYADI